MGHTVFNASVKMNVLALCFDVALENLYILCFLGGEKFTVKRNNQI